MSISIRCCCRASRRPGGTDNHRLPTSSFFIELRLPFECPFPGAGMVSRILPRASDIGRMVLPLSGASDQGRQRARKRSLRCGL